MVSSKGKLVKSESISKEAMNRSAFCSLMFAANSKESFNTNLFLVRLDNMGTKNLARRQAGVLIAERMGLNGGIPSGGGGGGGLL